MRGEGGELYSGSSWSRACGSSNDRRNVGGGESEPSTELNIDITMLHRGGRQLGREMRSKAVMCVIRVQVSSLDRGYLECWKHVNESQDA
jgi:hypothetical protein